MAQEIERKFLIDSARLHLPAGGVEIKQGYLPLADTVNTAARIRVKGNTASIAIKGENRGAVRSEFEYAIPVEDAEVMLATLCQHPVIEKTRYEIVNGKHLWEIDIFQGDNSGLVVAEIELAGEHERFERPEWLSAEVTDDPRYYNSNLLEHPYKAWKAGSG